MPCDPPTCLEIPPAILPNGDVLTIPPSSLGSGTICSWQLDWYRSPSLPLITIHLQDSGPGAENTLRTALNGIANAGGRILDYQIGFLDTSGKCTLFVDVITGNPPPNPAAPASFTCPPGFYYDIEHEECVCIGDPACVALCGAAGVFDLRQCNEACCVSVFPGPGGGGGGGSGGGGGGSGGGGGRPDAPVPRGHRDLASLLFRERSPLISRFPAGVGLDARIHVREFVRRGRNRFVEMPRTVLLKNPTFRGAPTPIIAGCGCGLSDNYEEEI